MPGQPSIQDLMDACMILFGPHVYVSLDFINYLQPEGLKSAYRKKALETHPDRAVTTGADVVRMKEAFIAATCAYEKLNTVVTKNGILLRKHPDTSENHCKPADHPIKKPSEKAAGLFFTGPIPRRKLLICQFLYYSGCISWNTYIDALVWQKRQRPAIGRLAINMGILSQNDIWSILRRRTSQEKFGESAIRLGYLTPYKLMLLLGKQRRLQGPIGDFFVLSGVLTRRQVEQMARKQAAHNQKFR